MIRRLLILSLALATLLLSACGDKQAAESLTAHKLVTITETGAMSLPGEFRAASTDTSILWLSESQARRDTRGRSFLVDGPTTTVTMVNHVDRTWTTMSAAEVQAQLNQLALDNSESGNMQLERIKDMLDVAARVTDTGQTETIDGYQCKRWIVEMNMGKQETTSEVWLTKDIDVDYSLLQYISTPALSAIPGGKGALRELAKLEGVPVLSTALLRIMNREGQSESRLHSVDTVQLSPDFFLPPTDYADTDAQ